MKKENKENEKIRKINLVCEARLKKYFEITGKALAIAKKAINPKKKKDALEVLNMALRYFEDAKWFKEQGHYINAFAALNYAHGWLDAGARLGLWDTEGSELFTV